MPEMMSSILSGFTARNRISLRDVTVSLESVVSMEYFARIFSRVSFDCALAIIWLVLASEELRMPPIMALPMFPAPIKPMILSNIDENLTFPVVCMAILC